MTIVCWLLTIGGSGLVLVSARQADIYRCWDGWTNRGEQVRFHAIAALIVAGPAIARALWLLRFRDGSRAIRWWAVALTVAVPVVVALVAWSLVPDAPRYGTCGD